MITRVVELVIKRFYRVYVDDPDGSMTEEQIKAKAIEQALESEDNMSLSEEMDIEEEDIVSAEYQYDI